MPEMPTTRERKELDDLKGTLRQRTAQLVKTERELQALLDAAEHFVEVFTQIKLARGYRM
jgi:hypothetical protein